MVDMFSFTVRYFGFLKHIPLLPLMFDAMLRGWELLFHRANALRLDSLEEEVESWPEVTTHLHKYGGIQFDYRGKEIGHLHGNGVLDVLCTQVIGRELIAKGLAGPHHLFPKSGWVSCNIRDEGGYRNALEVMKVWYGKIKG